MELREEHPILVAAKNGTEGVGALAPEHMMSAAGKPMHVLAPVGQGTSSWSFS